MIIGLTGKKQSGKTTAATYLRNNYGFEEVTFAAPLKKMAAIMLDVDASYFEGTEAQKTTKIPYWNITGREFLQCVGTELFRNELPLHLPQLEGFWIKRLEKTLCDASPDSLILVSDVRFPDEAALIKKFGGIIIGIVSASFPTQEPDAHASENQDIKCDRIIKNKFDNTFYEELDKLYYSF